MGVSFSHRFGQMIGDMLEAAIRPVLAEFAKKHKLYLDFKGERLTRKGKKLTWVDVNENKHDLDYVLERNGTGNVVGTPVAFIETAWRSYTRHSKAKAQEMQAALLPLLEKYRHMSPFVGIVLGGDFTRNAVTQLASCGFTIMHFTKESIVAAYKAHGIDADFDDDTLEEEFERKVRAWEAHGDKTAVERTLLTLNKGLVEGFIAEMEDAITRRIDSIIIWPLHGNGATVTSVEDAINFLNSYNETAAQYPFVKYEIIVKYNTGKRIEATCMNKAEALDFLALNT